MVICMKCPECGAEFFNGGYCPDCGVKLVSDSKRGHYSPSYFNGAMGRKCEKCGCALKENFECCPNCGAKTPLKDGDSQDDPNEAAANKLLLIICIFILIMYWLCIGRFQH